MQVLRSVLSYGLIRKSQGYKGSQTRDVASATITDICDLILSFPEFLASLPDFRERERERRGSPGLIKANHSANESWSYCTVLENVKM